jgi:hypothetical protein
LRPASLWGMEFPDAWDMRQFLAISRLCHKNVNAHALENKLQELY